MPVCLDASLGRCAGMADGHRRDHRAADADRCHAMGHDSCRHGLMQGAAQMSMVQDEQAASLQVKQRREQPVTPRALLLQVPRRLLQRHQIAPQDPAHERVRSERVRIRQDVCCLRRGRLPMHWRGRPVLLSKECGSDHPSVSRLPTVLRALVPRPLA